MLAGAISLWFDRGRAFLAVLCLVVAYVAYRTLHMWRESWTNPLPAPPSPRCACSYRRTWHCSACCPSAGCSTSSGCVGCWSSLPSSLSPSGCSNEGVTGFADWVAEPLFDFTWLKASVIPQGALLVMLLSLLVVAVRALLQEAPIDAAMAGALAAFGLAAQHARQPTIFGLFIASGALLLLIGGAAGLLPHGVSG